MIQWNQYTLYFSKFIFFSLYTDIIIFQYSSSSVLYFILVNDIINLNEINLILLYYKCNIFNHAIILIFVHVINFRETVSRNIVHFFLSINRCLYGVINLKFELQNFNSSSLALTLQNSEQLQMIRLQKTIFTIFAFQSFINNYLYYRPYI